MKRSPLFSAFLDNSTNEQTKQRGWVLVSLSFLLAGILLYLALKDLDWISFLSILRRANYTLVPLILLWGSLAYLVRALRWRVLLAADGDISVQETFRANMAGYLGNNLLPARAGELIRAVYVSRITKISMPFALASGFSERLMDVVALTLIGSGALAVSGIVISSLIAPLRLMSLVSATGLGIILLLPYFSRYLPQAINHFPFLGFSTKGKLIELLEKVLAGFTVLTNFRRAITFTLLTVLIWLLDGCSLVFTGWVLHTPLTLIQALVLLTGLGLSSAIPSVPGYIGIYQFVAVTVLGQFGIESAAALAMILFMQMNNWLVVIGWGLFSIAKFSQTVSQTKSIKQQA